MSDYFSLCVYIFNLSSCSVNEKLWKYADFTSSDADFRWFVTTKFHYQGMFTAPLINCIYFSFIKIPSWLKGFFTFKLYTVTSVQISKYHQVVDIPNSMTVLTELLPAALLMAKKKTVGVMNFTNPVSEYNRCVPYLLCQIFSFIIVCLFCSGCYFSQWDFNTIQTGLR